eukprot:gb/GECH01005779.1/.p1 GENE.gb/GECH01005779.1/~~gb/GECH01005779.1/.p1  ORF type:complete len:242 (+),score=54.26 gb/GECH01005779.1/:1-726(+)
MVYIICISDTHGKHEDITEHIRDQVSRKPSGHTCVMIHAGDWTIYGRKNHSFLSWLKQWTCFDRIYLVLGNHELPFGHIHNSDSELSQLLQSHQHIQLLNRSSDTFDNITFFGCPFEGFFQPDPKLQALWNSIADPTHVLITHAPPASILDQQHGCTHLLDRIRRLTSLRAHVFGHIHGGYGSVVLDREQLAAEGAASRVSRGRRSYEATRQLDPPPIHFVNAAIQNAHGKGTNNPISILI